MEDALAGKIELVKGERRVRLLDRVDSPADLKPLTVDELKQLATEIRELSHSAVMAAEEGQK
ncbi:MAG: hypothetical protein ACRD1Z_22715, partial [Vicinamibacteria bacterium]